MIHTLLEYRNVVIISSVYKQTFTKKKNMFPTKYLKQYQNIY